METLSRGVLAVLAKSGWHPEHDASDRLDEWARRLGNDFTVFPAAREVLRRFGGILVEQSGPGEELSRESFCFDPSLAVGEGPRFKEFSALVGSSLFPLGEYANGHSFLAVDEGGRVFALMDDLWIVGPDIITAIENLVFGRGVRRLTP